MRVCLLCSRFPPQRCGVGDYTYFLSCALARTGFDVDVVTAVGELDALLYPVPANVHVHRVVESWEVRQLPALVRYLRRLDPGAIAIQYTPQAFDRRGIPLAINLLPAIARGLWPVRVFTNFHEVYIPFGGSGIRRAGAVWQRLVASMLASCSTGLSITYAQWARCLRRVGVRSPMQLIPVGSNIPRIEITGEVRDHLRRQVMGDSDGILVVAFGEQHDRDVSGAIGALRQLQKYERAKLLWIGGGVPSERYRLKMDETMQTHGLSQEDVEWTGELPHPQVSGLLGASDVMLLPFLDGVSTRRTSAVTALQHGLPLLTTRGRYHEPHFVHGQNIYGVPCGDTRALADGLLTLARSPELRAHLAESGRATYQAVFGWDVIAERVSGLLREDHEQADRGGSKGRSLRAVEAACTQDRPAL